MSFRVLSQSIALADFYGQFLHIKTEQGDESFQFADLVVECYSAFHIKPGSRLVKKHNIRVAD